MTWYEIYDDSYIDLDKFISFEINAHPDVDGDHGIWAEMLSGEAKWLIYGYTLQECQEKLKDIISKSNKGEV